METCNPEATALRPPLCAELVSVPVRFKEQGLLKHHEMPLDTLQGGDAQKDPSQQVMTGIWRNGNLPTLLVGMSNGAAMLGNILATPKRLSHEVTM